MPTIRYHEFRPGRWVKLVDGKAVGPATAEEVAAWKRELAGQAQIWEDVLKHAAPSQATASAPEPAQTSQYEQPAAPPVSVASTTPVPPETRATAEPTPAAPPRILRTVEEIRAAKVAARAEVAEPAPQSVREMQATPATVEQELQLSQPAGECPAARTEPLAETETETQSPAQPTPEAESSLAIEAVTEPAELAAPVHETVQPMLLAAPVEPAAMPGLKLPEQSAEAGIEPAVVTLAVPHYAEAQELLPEQATLHDQDAEAEPEPEEEPATVAEAAEVDEAAEQWEKPAEAQPAEMATEEGPEEARETEPEEVALPEEDGSRAYARRSHSTAHAAAAKKRAFPSSRDLKGPEYVWFVTAPTDDLIAAVRAGLAKYQERFSQPAGAVLCHAVDLPALEEAALGVDVRQSKGVPAHNFWIGPK